MWRLRIDQHTLSMLNIGFVCLLGIDQGRTLPQGVLGHSHTAKPLRRMESPMVTFCGQALSLLFVMRFLA